MSNSVDQRIVEMQFDNAQFEKGVAVTLASLKNLDQSLQFKEGVTGIKNIDSAISKVDFTNMERTLTSINEKFSVLGIVGVTAVSRLANSMMDLGIGALKAATIDPLTDGLDEYKLKMDSIKTIQANTGLSDVAGMKRITDVLDELNEYADKTIYNFAEMTRNIGTFTAAGVGLEESAVAIKGIANLAAASGSNSHQASVAMYQLSQALAAGTVKLMDWNSVVNAGMGGQMFQKALIETSRALGTGADDYIAAAGSFRESLKEGWITSEVLTKTLRNFTLTNDEANRQMLLQEGYNDQQIDQIFKVAAAAEAAATKVKTFQQLIDTTKEALGSGWASTWEFIIGDIIQAETLWTSVSEGINGVIDSLSNARNDFFQAWNEGRTPEEDQTGGWWDMYYALSAFADLISAIVQPIKDAFSDVFGIVRRFDEVVNEDGSTTKVLVSTFRDLGLMAADATHQFREFAEGLAKSFKESNTGKMVVRALYAAFKALFTIVKVGGAIIGGVLYGIGVAVNTVASVVMHAIELVMTPINMVFEFFESLDYRALFEPIISFFKDTLRLESVAEVFEDIANGIHSIFDYIRGDEGAVEALNEFFGAISEDFSTIADDAARGLHGLAQGFGEIAKIGAGAVFQGLLWGFEQLQKIWNKVQPVFEVIKEALVGAWNVIVDAFYKSGFSFDPFIKMFSGFGGAFQEFLENTINNGFSFEELLKLFDKLGASVGTLIDELAPSFMTFAETVGSAIRDNLDGPLGTLFDIVSNLGSPLDILSGAMEGLGNAFKAISEFKFPWDQSGEASPEGAASALGKVYDGFKSVEIVAKALANPAKTISGFVSSGLNGLLTGINDFVNSIDKTQLDEFVSRIMQLGSMGAIIAGLYEMMRFLDASAGLLEELKKIPKVLNSLGTELTNTVKTIQTGIKAHAVKEIGIAVALLVGSLLLLTLVDVEKLASVMPYFAGIALGLVGVFVALGFLANLKSFDEYALTTFTTNMLLFSVAIGTLAVIVAALGALPQDVVGQGVAAIAGIALIFAGLALVLSRAAKVGTPAATLALSSLAGAIASLIAVMAILGMLPDGALLKGLIAFTFVSMILSGMAMLMQKIGGLKFEVAASGMLGLAAALGILAGAVALLSMFDTVKVIGSAAAIGLLMVALGTMAFMIGKIDPIGFQAAAVGILAISAAIAILSASLAGVALVATAGGDIQLAAEALVFLILALTAASAVIGTVGTGLALAAPALISFAIAVAALAAALVVFSYVPAEQLNTALLQMAGAMFIFVVSFGLIAVIATICAAGIAAISGFAMAVGTAAMLIGIGALAFATSLGIMAAAGPEAATAMIESIKIIGQGLWDTQEEIAMGIAGLIGGVVTGILLGIPAIAAAILVAIGALVGVLIASAPLVGAGAVLVAAGLIDGLAVGIEEYGPKLVDALIHLGEVIVTGVMGALTDGVNQFNDWLYDVTGGLMGVDTDAVRAQGQETGEAYGSGLSAGLEKGEQGINGFREQFNSNIDGMKGDAFSGGGDVITSLLGGAQSQGLSVDELLNNLPPEYRDELSSLVDFSGTSGSNLMSNINSGVSSGAEEFKSNFKSIINGALDSVETATGSADRDGHQLVSSMNDGAESELASNNPASIIIDSVTSELNNAADEIASASENVADAASSSFENGFDFNPGSVLESARSAISNSAGAFQAAGNEAAGAAADGANSGIARFKSNISTGVSGASSLIRAVSSSMYSAGFAAGVQGSNGLADGISSVMWRVSNAAQNIANKAAEAMRNALRINSPSKVTMAIGEGVGEGFALGMFRSTAMVAQSAEDLSNAAVASVVNQAALLSSLLSDIDAAPTITPVLDLDGVMSDISSLNGMLLTSQMLSAGTVGAFAQRRAEAASSIDNSRANNYYFDLQYDAGADANDLVMGMARSIRARSLLEG